MNEISAEEKAVNLRNQGYNCCQAVVGGLTGDPNLIRAASGFGGGMGNTQGPCGALVGAIMAAGVKTDGYGTGRYSRQIYDKFQQRSGAVICRELKGIGTGKVLCSCEDCVRNGVRVFEEVAGK